MSELEIIIENSKTIEGILETKFSASGRGLHEKLTSVHQLFEEKYIRLIRKTATIRNKSLHESGYKINDIDRFARDSAEIITYLNNLNISSLNNTDLSTLSNYNSLTSPSLSQRGVKLINSFLNFILIPTLVLASIAVVLYTAYHGYLYRGIGAGIIGLIIGLLVSSVIASIVYDLIRVTLTIIHQNFTILFVSLSSIFIIYFFWGVKLLPNEIDSKINSESDNKHVLFKKPNKKLIYLRDKNILGEKYINELSNILRSTASKNIPELSNVLRNTASKNIPEKSIKYYSDQKVIVEISFNRAGKLISSNIVDFSDTRVLDKAALKLVELSSPFKAVPKTIPYQYKSFKVRKSFVFDLYNRRVNIQ